MTEAANPHQAHDSGQTVKVNSNPDQSGLEVIGRVNFKNVVKLRRAGTHLLQQLPGAAVTVDLRGLDQSDNSGLVLLVAWMEDAQGLQKTLTFLNTPDFLQRMATVFGLQSILFNNQA